MRDIKVGAVQFEMRDGAKAYNLARIEALTAEAAAKGAEVVSFHECCITGYTYLMPMSREAVVAVAEPVPDGPSTAELIRISRKHGVAVLAGLVEIDGDAIYNTYVAVDQDGFVARHRKLHPFISEYMTAGDSYTVFELRGCRCGLLICYDNNLVENVRMTTLLGADVIFMPHVTCGSDSPMPGRGVFDREAWACRERDPARCRLEFAGPKGRGWLMRWLPARAYENGVYAVFTNPIGWDYDTLRNGNAMILDPYGEVVVESNALGDDVVVGLLTPEKIPLSAGRRHIKARRPELYGKLVERRGEDDGPVTRPIWMGPADSGS